MMIDLFLRLRRRPPGHEGGQQRRRREHPRGPAVVHRRRLFGAGARGGM